MRLLLTGGTGFLGRNVTRVLAERGHSIRVLHRKSSNLDSIRQYIQESITSDITDPLGAARACHGIDAVVHMAADLSHWRANRERIYRTNVLGTRLIAEAVKTAGVETLVHVSSIAAVGYSEDGAPIDEASPNNFVPLRLLYHESKRLAEEEALDARRYGIKVTIVNPGVLYGPRELSHTFGHTMVELARGQIPGHPTGGLSITDVDDVAQGIASALERGKGQERYLLAGHNLTYQQSFEAQAEAVGARYSGRAIPSAVLRLAAAIFETQSRLTGREPRLTRDNAIIAPLKMWYSSAKAERELGYQIRPLEETLARTAAYYRGIGAI